MSMPLHDIIGFVAGFGTTFAAMPDLIAMLKRRSCEGMNPTMAAIMGTFQIVWVYYGILVESRPVIVWNMIAVAINFLVVGAYFYFACSVPRHAPLANHPPPGEGTKGSSGR
jgi:MtN3 and saliva related transmembrane protein